MSNFTDDQVMDAILKDDAATLKTYLEKGGDPHRTLGDYRVHPMRWAADKNARACLDLLLENGCSPDEGDRYGTPLGVAGFEMALYLLERGADPNIPSGSDAEIKLFVTNNPEMIQALLKHGAKTEIRGYSRFAGPNVTPLLDAIAERKEKKVELLLNAGADINAKGEWEWATAIGIVNNDIQQDLKYLRTATSTEQAQALCERIGEHKRMAEKLVLAGAGTSIEDNKKLTWIRSLDLTAMERSRKEILALGKKEAAAKPDFIEKVKGAIGSANAATGKETLTFVITGILAKPAIKFHSGYAGLFALCCNRQSPLVDHMVEIFEVDPNTWDREADESGMVESFADGEYDNLTELCGCLSDAAFAATPEWRICFDSLLAAAARIDRYPNELKSLVGKKFVKARPDYKELTGVVKELLG